MKIPLISRSFSAKAAISVLLGIVAVMGPISLVVADRTAVRVYTSLESQLRSVAVGLARPITNLLILDNELELELTVAQLTRDTFLQSIGVANLEQRWVSHTDTTLRGQPLSAELVGLTDGLHRMGLSYVFKWPLEFSDKQVGMLILDVPADFVDAPVRDTRRQIWLVACGTAAIAVVILVIILLVLLRPIPAIRAFAKRIATGDWGSTLPNRRIDEVGQVINSLNDMSRELQAAQANRLEKELLDKEMRLAAEIQSALIPEQAVVPDFVHMVSHFEAAKTVGGDFYYCAQSSKGSYYAIVADVSGKGIGSALLGSQIQGMFASLLHFSPSPHAAFKHINKVIREQASTDLYCTAAAVAVTSEGTVQMVNAGHPGIRLYRNSGKLETFECDSPALCVLDSATFADELYTTELQLHPGDKLILFSDGLTETFNEEGAMFGDARLDASIRRNPATISAADLFSRLYAEVTAFRGSQPLPDDLTVVVIEMA